MFRKSLKENPVLWIAVACVCACFVAFFDSSLFAQESKSPQFELDVLPLLTKHGCNSGACHGSVAGRGHFRLSLWGSDPSSDYEQIVHAFGSRRIRYQVPEESLLIAKPSGMLAHEGGERFDPESTTAELIKRWIADGTPYGQRSKIEEFEIHTEAKVPSLGSGSELLLKAFARIEGSASRIEVTDRTSWDVDSSAGMDWTGQNPPAIQLVRPGRNLITARFAGQVRTLVLVSPYPVPQGSMGPSTGAASTGAASTGAASTGATWIDREIQQLLEQANVQPLPTIDDLTWLRRISLDLVGRIPTLEEIRSFESVDLHDRKIRTVERLVASDGFQDYWTYKLARWLGLRPIANEPQATKAFEFYLRDQIVKRRSWKQIAQELFLTLGDSHELGQANFSRLAADPRSHAELVSRVFLGVRLQCANCHNHPLDRWTQDDYHGLSAILAGIDRSRNVQIAGSVQVTNLRTNEPAIPKLPGGDYLSIQSDAESTARNLAVLSDWVFDDSDPKFARMLANRLWASMMGRGLIEPIDDLRETNPASHPHLLEMLTSKLIESDYQPVELLKSIALSDSYARMEPGADAMRLDPSFFAGHVSKPLAPEVLYDAIHDALGVVQETRSIRWIDPTVDSESLDILGRCGRPNACDSSTSKGSVASSLSQQLHWINGPLVNRAIESPMGFLRGELSRGSSDAAILQQGYLRILSRYPKADDVERWLDEIPKDPKHKQAWFEDWAWGMLSSNRFLSN